MPEYNNHQRMSYAGAVKNEKASPTVSSRGYASDGAYSEDTDDDLESCSLGSWYGGEDASPAAVYDNYFEDSDLDAFYINYEAEMSDGEYAASDVDCAVAYSFDDVLDEVDALGSSEGAARYLHQMKFAEPLYTIEERSHELQEKLAHKENFSAVLKDIRGIGVRADALSELEALDGKLKDLQQATLSLGEKYQAQNAIYKNNSFLSVMRSSQPAEHRLAAVSRIQKIAKTVAENSFGASRQGSDEMIAHGARRLRQSIATIKGAALKEYQAISNEYYVRSPENSALLAVLNQAYGCSTMSEQAMLQAQEAFAQHEAKASTHSKEMVEGVECAVAKGGLAFTV